MKRIFQEFQKAMMAVAFAEEGCPEQALSVMQEKTVSRPKESLESFLCNIGLQNVRVCYGVVRI
jgi:hypothetical protein